MRKQATPIVQSVAILGSGPSSAFATWACFDAGIRPVIFALGERTLPPGAFFLHHLPSTFERRDIYATGVWWLSIGSADNYVRKMWGSTGIPSSFPTEPHFQKGFNSAALHEMWDQATFRKLSKPLKDRDVRNISKDYDLVIQTFPNDEGKKRRGGTILFPILYREFPATPIYMLLYSGDSSSWSRMTMGGGRVSFEFPADYTVDPPFMTGGWTMGRFPDLKPFTKPYLTGSNLNVIMVGRFARWDRNFLSHEAYDLVAEAIRNPPC